MFTVTPDQEYILAILRKTRFMRTDQACRLLRCLNKHKTEEYVIRSLHQLRHMQKIIWKTEEIFAMPSLYEKPADEKMLAALDIMTDLTEYKVTVQSANNSPYKLCFFTEQQDSFGCYAVVIVTPGSEARISAVLYGTDTVRTIIFLLSDLSQKEGIKTNLPHFFAIEDNGKYRYFKGGD